MHRIVFAAAISTALLTATGADARSGSAFSEFAVCADAGPGALEGSLCAKATMPLREDDSTLGEVELFVRRFPAQGVSRGDVWLVAGGPGESGGSFYGLVDRFRAAFPDYDLIVPDHRGTGRSSRVCVSEEASESPAGSGLEGAEWATCFGQLEARSPWVQSFTITNAAYDLRGLIDRYSRGRRTWVYGVSYGTQLVLRMMTVVPPASVHGIVLDSLVPPDATEVWDLSHRSQVVDEVGRGVLADCDRDPACRIKLDGSATEALRRLENDPERAKLFPGGKPKAFFGALLDSPEARALIPDVIADALAGRTEALERAQERLTAFTAPFASSEASSSVPLVALISASENNARPTLARADIAAEEAGLLFTSSLPGQLVGGADISYPKDATFGVSPAHLPPVLVLQGDMDPKTAHAGAVAHAAILAGSGDVRLVTVQSAPHFVLLTDPERAVGEISAFVAGTAKVAGQGL